MFTGEVSVQEPPDVSYHGLVQVEITEASRQPSRGGVLPPNPALKASRREGRGKGSVQPFVCSCDHVARLVVHNRPRHFLPPVLRLHFLKQARQGELDKLCQVFRIVELGGQLCVIRGNIASI